jgi:Transposase DDE domain
MDILPVFCDIDDFCLLFEPAWQGHLLADGAKHRHKPSALSLSEVMTLLVWFHASGYRDFKTFYLQYVQKHLAGAFPRLVSYNRFVELQREALIPLWCYLQTRFGQCTGIAFVDATTLAVCHNLRIPQHKVFWGSARRGQSSMGWFYGFKLHLCINDCGELLGCYLTPGNVDDRRPVPHMVKDLWGRLFGDKGYISQALTTLLQAQELQLVTKLKKNMKNRFLSLSDKLLLRKRSLIETVNDQLKNISQVEHTRHRSLWNFLGNVAAGLIAYTWREKKPSLNIHIKEQFLMSN